MRIDQKYTRYGVIGKSGTFYPCMKVMHEDAKCNHRDDAPFVDVRGEDQVTFEAYYTCDKTEPTSEQFETLMDWCASQYVIFETVTDCFDAPWRKFRA